MDIKTFATTLFITGVATCGSAHANDPSGSLNVSPRETKSLVTWQFSRDSLHWQTVRIPHDWAIAGPFDKKWDIQYVAIEQNGEKEKTEKSGRSGALPWLGHGYYSTHVTLSQCKGRRVMLNFDGAMAEPTVYVNGKRAGHWAYGYTPFRLDITPYINDGDNVVTVSLSNMEESSRWYPGAGLYRPVTLEILPELHIDPWKTIITTEKNHPNYIVEYKTTIPNVPEGYRLRLDILDSKGKQIKSAEQNELKRGAMEYQFTLDQDSVHLWSPETPYLYRCVTTLLDDSGHAIDKMTTKFGIRTITIDSIHGFQLNGVSRKIKGVCLHHDLGPLGAAVNKAAIIRQVKQLKDMGADAIRTAHNMPSQIQMDVCDSLGMMVMAESFDMWIYPKCKNGYSRFFKEWSDRDITNLIEANRNHPSIIMWSIGNEIPEQWSYEGRIISEHLQNLCHQLDPTRMVTQGMDKAEAALNSGFAQVMDVPGFTSRVYKYDRNMKKLTTGFILGSETASTVSSRGVYHFPVKWDVATPKKDGQCSSYDVEWCSWSNLPEEDFMAMEDKPYTIGQFVWTGYDYLGEPTPYDEYWPSRSSYFGIMDLAGLPKDRYYLYRSVWNNKEHTLHILPHWTWPGREGKVTPVFVYTDYPEAELFVNGKSQGRVKKQLGLKTDDQHPSTPEIAKTRAKRYRLMWDNVVYEPGELKVVAYNKNGQRAAETSVRTAGAANALKLESDRLQLTADGNDLAYITVSLIDKNGVELPQADDEIEVAVSGAGQFRAICNGDATSLESFATPRMKLFNGKLVITIQSGKDKGNIKVKVRDSKHKLSKQIVIKVK